MSREKIYIAEIGLTDTDLRLIQTAFKHDKYLSRDYVLNTKDLSHGSDIVLLNIDSVIALEEWDEQEDKGLNAETISLTSDSHKFGDGITVHRPLSLKKIVSAIQTVGEELRAKKAEKPVDKKPAPGDDYLKSA